MLTKISNDRSPDKQLNGDEVTVGQIIDLSKNYFKHSYIEEKGHIRKMNCENGHVPEKNDTRTITFKKSRIDEFFAANPGSDDFIIHIGLHDKKIYDAHLPGEYEGKLMVVLSTKDLQKLAEGDVVMIAGINGGGIDNGKLCPPDLTCPV
ncbi:hypothetical protein NAF17_14310 [Mucilaginibacter sp. RB4R14]|uniref:hypothetical protein n=1 Tax=Mucilaginibacter aurantiaciroseus TaxID=2949308 RepID=UPI002091258E|nr:hypothetical protein [Mucilaginibacter aurantiaciroseus]MCO5936713.1 hypothetical protein [Mucilaginibacter aurantiaciroseus]